MAQCISCTVYVLDTNIYVCRENVTINVANRKYTLVLLTFFTSVTILGCANRFPYSNFKKYDEISFTTSEGYNSSCLAPTGWREILDASKGKALSFGERHGQEKSPFWFGQFVCAVGSTGAKIVVLLEIPEEFDESLNKGLTAEDPATFWQTEMALFWCAIRDNRPSRAWYEMLLHLSEQKKSGVDISVRTLSEPTVRPPYNSRYYYEAQRIEKFRDKGAIVIALSGNVHPVAHKKILGKENIFTIISTSLDEKSADCISDKQCYSLSLEILQALPSKPKTMLGIIGGEMSSAFGQAYDGYMHFGVDKPSPRASRQFSACRT